MNLIRALFFLIVTVSASKLRRRHVRLSGHHSDRALALGLVEDRFEQKYQACFPPAKD